MLFGKWFNAAPTFPRSVATMPRGVVMPGPTMPHAQVHSFPTSMPATNTGVFTTQGGSGPLPYCDQVGCNGTTLSCYGAAAGAAAVCGCPQPDGSIIQCQRRSFPPCSQACIGLVACDVNGCHCQAADGSTIMCSGSVFNANSGPQAGPDNGSTWNDGTTDQNVDSSSGAPNDGSGAATSNGSSPVCDAGMYYSPAFNMCVPQDGAPVISPPVDTTTTTTTTTDPSTGQVSTTQVVTPTPILTPLPGIPDAPLFYQTPAFKVGVIALGVSVLGVAAILVHRARSA